ncbi:MAG: nuclear transport factor 2 family protein [Thermoleophilia bacterium]|nr:nuclear transport factor 2 family protein [Thermoleophilia bacterium]MDH4340778.1 nuclear transport factor 2 family protein [Thermoleophilia bacterium]
MPETTPDAAVEAVLDAFHAAAAATDEVRYFAALSPNAVFLGTAPGERWAGDDFRSFVHSYFSRGKGWTYISSDRSVEIAADGQTAWFDETVANEFYGQCRGTGVLQLNDGKWRIEQYNLTIPIPDELAADVVTTIGKPC